MKVQMIFIIYLQNVKLRPAQNIKQAQCNKGHYVNSQKPSIPNLAQIGALSYQNIMRRVEAFIIAYLEVKRFYINFYEAQKELVQWLQANQYEQEQNYQI